MTILEEEIKAVKIITDRLDGWLHPQEGPGTVKERALLSK
jgi:hypothetical protein